MYVSTHTEKIQNDAFFGDSKSLQWLRYVLTGSCVHTWGLPWDYQQASGRLDCLHAEMILKVRVAVVWSCSFTLLLLLALLFALSWRQTAGVMWTVCSMPVRLQKAIRPPVTSSSQTHISLLSYYHWPLHRIQLQTRWRSNTNHT